MVEKTESIAEPKIADSPDISSAQPVRADELTAPLAEAMPAPTNSTVEETISPPALEIKDKRGKVFDPEKHRTGSDGRPLLDKNGNFYSANLGRPLAKAVPPKAPVVSRPPPSFASLPGGSPPESNGEAAPLSPSLPVGPDLAEIQAEAYLRCAYAPLVAALSADAKPDEEEHKILKDQLAAAFRTLKKIPEINVWVGFGTTAYVVMARKLDKPTVQQRWGLLVLRCKQMFARKPPALNEVKP